MEDGRRSTATEATMLNVITICQGPKEPTYDSFALPGRHHATMYFSVNRQPPEEQLGNGVEMETDTEATATHPTQNVKIFEWPGCSCATGKDGLAATSLMDAQPRQTTEQGAGRTKDAGPATSDG
ncbi:GD16567 [Drosophila simulans]|uniref:GD16567 n=1 Tax=Drosophila simulans TaxID=7240 RepID=B4R303_DROSI|nr:GD16567 [Drosophila simulans]